MRLLPFCLAGLILIALLSLSVWQLNRAQEKRTLASLSSTQQAAPTLTASDLNTIPKSALAWRDVTLTGHFSANAVYLLDNQTHEGRIGYHVLVPFYWTPQQWVLVNRGWIAAPSRRDEWPVIAPIKGQVSLSGKLRYPSHNRLVRAMTEQGPDDGWPQRIQAIDLSTITPPAGGEGLPVVLQLTEASPYLFVAPPPPTDSLSPARHIGYALQWALLAVAWLIIVIVIARGRRASEA